MGLRALAVDTTPLRVSRDFRLLWIGQAVSLLGSVMTMVALPWEVFERTHSSLDVGLLGVAQLVPLLALSVVGGAVADAVDRRSLMIRLELALAACSVLLALHASLAGHTLWPVYVLAAATSGISAMHFATLRSLVPLLLPTELRPAGFALEATYGTFAFMIGPAVAGALIAAVGLTATYAADAVTFVAALVAVVLITPHPPVAEAKASRASVLEGLRFVRGQQALVAVWGADLIAMVFGMPRALFPALALRLGGGARALGLLHAAVAAGSFLASISSGWAGRIRRHGRAIVWSVMAWGVAVAVVGLAHSIWLAVLLLSVAGAADMVSGVFRSTVAADVTPDELRGRITGLEFAAYASGPLLGDAESGAVAALAGVPFAIVSGGLACVAGAGLLAVLAPRLMRYERPAAGGMEIATL